MQAAKRSQLRRLLSSDDSDRQRSVAMSITVSISATQSHTPFVDTEDVRVTPFTYRFGQWVPVFAY